MNSFILWCLFLPLPLKGDLSETKFHPPKLGDGPLLSYAEIGCSRTGSKLYLVDPTIDRTPYQIWHQRGPVPTVEGRLSKHSLILKHGMRHFIADLKTGTIASLLPNKDQSTLLSVQNEELIFLHQAVPNPLRGVKLKRSEDGHPVVDDYHQARSFLYRYRPGEKAEQISELPIRGVIEHGPEGFWVLTADAPHRLVELDPAGKERRSIPLGADWIVFADINASFSPKRDYLALTLLGKNQHYHDQDKKSPKGTGALISLAL